MALAFLLHRLTFSYIRLVDTDSLPTGILWRSSILFSLSCNLSARESFHLGYRGLAIYLHSVIFMLVLIIVYVMWR